jgi:plastocyanin
MSLTRSRPPLPLRRTLLALLALLTLLSAMQPVAAQVPPADPPLHIDQIAVEQRLQVVNMAERPALQQNPTPNEQELVPGQRAILRFTFTNTGPRDVRLYATSQLSWGEPAPAELAQAGDDQPREPLAPWASFPLAAGASVTFERPVHAQDSEPISDELTLEPRDLFFVSRLTYCFASNERSDCPDPATNPTISAVDELRVPIRRKDLGDAPDSTNHFGVPMSAYPNVQANFPTVFDPSTGQPSGPLHLNPRPFHLGGRVSIEAGTDIGPDQDGLNNLIPPGNIANNDGFDDGLRPNLLGFADCQRASFPVDVFINPLFKTNALSAGVQVAYLNIWVDSKRDGDWDDATQCATTGGQAAPAVEHIVIDQPINLASLNGGGNLVSVTTGLVPWPAELAARPAWLRATLSLAKSTKTLQAGNLSYGDGRGNYDTTGQPIAFRSGETEDYLINREPSGNGRADVEVRKWGRIIPPEAGQADRFRVAWVIEYRNGGDAPAREVVIRDRMRGFNINDLISRLESRPELAPRPEGDTLNFNIGTLEPGRIGRIAFVTTLPLSATPGLAVSNSVSISASNDNNPENNQATAEAELRLAAPLILSPGSGATCAGEVQVRGLALNATSVEVYVDGALVATVPVGEGNGEAATAQVRDPYNWQADLALSDGPHQIVAVARRGDVRSERSNPINILVDTSLPYDPLSLRFIAEGNERGFRPVGPDGATGDGGWVVPLRANTTYTFSVRSCCDPADNAEFSLKIGAREAIVLSDPDGDRVYTGSFTTGETEQSVPFTLLVVWNGERHIASGVIRSVSFAKVFDARTRQPLAGALVTLLACNEEGVCQPATNVGNNPQVTGENGAYDFSVPAGSYVLAAAKEGYYPFRSRIFTIVEQALQFPIVLRPIIASEPTHRVTIDENGFDSSVLRVRPGSIIEFANVDVWEHAIISPRDPASGQANGLAQTSNGLDSGAIGAGESFVVQFNGPSSGTTTYTISDGEDGFNTLTVIVDANAAPNAGGYLVRLPMVIR